MLQGLESFPFICAKDVYLTMITPTDNDTAFLPENSLLNIFPGSFNVERSQGCSSRCGVQIKTIRHVIYKNILFLGAKADIPS